jgi:hypothetical protein
MRLLFHEPSFLVTSLFKSCLNKVVDYASGVANYFEDIDYDVVEFAEGRSWQS